MKKTYLPKKISIFPLSNFIIFPKTTVPLNIFEPRYLEMINDSMKTNKLVGMIQPKNSNDTQKLPILHDIGCLGKITSFTQNNPSKFPKILMKKSNLLPEVPPKISGKCTLMTNRSPCESFV